MTRKFEIKTRYLFLLLFFNAFVLAALITLTSEEVKDPVPPSNIPASSVWVGGPDGGNFFSCRLAAEIHCVLYEIDGKRTAEGDVAMEPWQRQKYQNIRSFYEDLVAYDGESIHFDFRTAARLK